MNKTKILSILLALVMVLGMLPVSAFATDSEDTTTGDLVVEITHISLNPAKDALGFKAKVEGSLESVTQIGFAFRVNGGAEKTFTATKTPEDGVFTARVQNILALKGGEATLEAYAFVRMGDVTVQSQWQATSMKDALQAVDAAWNAAGYTQAQKLAVKALCNQYKAQVEPWTLDNIFGGFFGNAENNSSSDTVDLTNDTGDYTGTATVFENGISFGYVDSFREDVFYFESQFHVNAVAETENWPKFGLFVESGNVREYFYVDMSRELSASVVGRMTNTDGVDDWANAVSANVENMAFSAEGQTVKLGVLKTGKRMHLFVDDQYVLSVACNFSGSAVTGIFSFNTGLVVTEYFVDLSQNTLNAKKELIPNHALAENFGGAEGYGTSNEIDLRNDNGSDPSIQIYGGAPQYAYLTDVYTDQFCFETEINVSAVLNNDNWPKFGIMVNGASEMVKFFVDMTPAMTATYVGVVYQPTGGGDDWAGSKSVEVPGMSFAGSDTIKLKLIRDGSAYYFYVNDALVLNDAAGFQAEPGAVGIFSFNAELTATNYSVGVGEQAVEEGMTIGMTQNWFTQGDEGAYTLTTNSDEQHKVDDLTRGGIVVREANYRVSGKITLSDAADWGQARILISSDAQNEYFIALEKLPAGNYQLFTMSKANQEGWDNWVLLSNVGRNSQNFEVVVIGDRLYFLLGDMICYETDHVAMTESTVKFTGFNVGTTTVENLDLEIFSDSDAAAAYIAGKAYRPQGTQEAQLTTNYFTETGEGVYTLTTNSDAQHLVDDVLADGLGMRDDFYSVQGKITLTDANEWGQARILVSADAQNEYFIALEKLPSGNYQIFSMSKANQESWDVWQVIADENANGTRNRLNFELIVIGNQVHMLVDGKLVYKTTRVEMTESTVKFTGYNVGTTTVEDLSLRSFSSREVAESYLQSANATESVSYKNQLNTIGADPGVVAITEGKDAGSYYMYVTSDSLGCTGYLAYRSWDLVNWECVSTALSAGEAYYEESTGRNIAPYLTTDYWAPEVIYDAEDKLYYMFYNADRYDDAGYFYGDIAVSSDPAGPFIPYNRYLGNGPVLINADENTWAYKPVFDFTKMDASHPLYETASEGYMKVIDLSPFVDPVSGQKYVYFCHDVSTALEVAKSSIYVMKLNADYTPDYTSVTSLTTAESALDEGKVNEAPFVLYKSGKYYLLYSVNRYYQTTYSVRVAVADSSVGPFTKLTEAEGGYLLSGTNGTGHCSVVSQNGQDYMVYHAHKEKTDEVLIRGIAMDALNWVENANGLLVPVANGPSVSAMPLITGNYSNMAGSATLTSTPVSGSADALTDGIIAHSQLSFLPEAAFSGETTIRLDFAKTTVYGVGIYDSVNSPCAGITSVRLILENGQSICYTGVTADEMLQTVPTEAVAIEIVMSAADSQYGISEIVVMSKA